MAVKYSRMASASLLPQMKNCAQILELPPACPSLAFSQSRTLAPAFDADSAAAMPAMPIPRTTTSYSLSQATVSANV